MPRGEYPENKHYLAMQHTTLRVRHQFCVQIPLGSDLSTLDVAPMVIENGFGIALTSHTSPSCYQYRIKIVTHDARQEEFGNCFSWVKRNPISFEVTPKFHGIALRAKIDHGTFDFRRINELLIRVKVECFLDGNYLQHGRSPVMKLLPKNRKKSAENRFIDGKHYLILKLADLTN
jgi:hypothetical protein